MISVTELRAGTTFRLDKDIYEAMTYEHVKMGRGSATIRVKIRNLRTGSITEKSFTNGAVVDPISLEKTEAQFLYKTGEEYTFMDPATFEQFSIPERIIGSCKGFLTEGLTVSLLSLDGEYLSIQLPIKMEFIVTDTPPGVKGNSASNIWKEATITTGFKVKVPLFVDIGDKIRVNTGTGEYVDRVTK